MDSTLSKIVKWLSGIYTIGILLLLPLFWGINYPLPIPYPWMKVIHLSAVIILMGNMIIGPIWLYFAIRMKNNPMLYFSIYTICWLDVILTAPAFVIALLSGMLLSPQWGGFYTTQWVFISLLLIAFAVVLAIPVMKAQYKLFQLVSTANEKQSELPNEFKQRMNAWSIWGSFIMIPFIAVFILMIVKPVLY